MGGGVTHAGDTHALKAKQGPNNHQSHREDKQPSGPGCFKVKEAQRYPGRQQAVARVAPRDLLHDTPSRIPLPFLVRKACRVSANQLSAGILKIPHSKHCLAPRFVCQRSSEGPVAGLRPHSELCPYARTWAAQPWENCSGLGLLAVLPSVTEAQVWAWVNC